MAKQNIIRTDREVLKEIKGELLIVKSVLLYGIDECDTLEDFRGVIAKTRERIEVALKLLDEHNERCYVEAIKPYLWDVRKQVDTCIDKIQSYME